MSAISVSPKPLKSKRIDSSVIRYSPWSEIENSLHEVFRDLKKHVDTRSRCKYDFLTLEGAACNNSLIFVDLILLATEFCLRRKTVG